MAIAFDVASNGRAGPSVTSLTFSHTCTGSNLILVVGTSVSDTTDTNRPVTGITYAGVAMTKIREDDEATADFTSGLWYLINPATGANNIVVTTTGSVSRIIAGGISLTGAAQSGQPDAHNGALTTTTSITVDVTTVADNCWVIDAYSSSWGGTNPVAGGGQTQRWINAGTAADGIGSTEGPKTPAGAVTMSWTAGSLPSAGAISAASFAPSGVSAVTTLSSLLLMGVGM